MFRNSEIAKVSIASTQEMSGQAACSQSGKPQRKDPINRHQRLGAKCKLLKAGSCKSRSTQLVLIGWGLCLPHPSI